MNRRCVLVGGGGDLPVDPVDTADPFSLSCMAIMNNGCGCCCMDDSGDPGTWGMLFADDCSDVGGICHTPNVSCGQGVSCSDNCAIEENYCEQVVGGELVPVVCNDACYCTGGENAAGNLTDCVNKTGGSCVNVPASQSFSCDYMREDPCPFDCNMNQNSCEDNLCLTGGGENAVNCPWRYCEDDVLHWHSCYSSVEDGNCNCSGTAGYETGDYCQYDSSASCPYGCGDNDDCADWCSTSPACTAYKCGYVQSFANNGQNPWIHSWNSNCIGSSCGFDEWEFCEVVNSEGDTIWSGCNDAGTNCQNNLCLLNNVSCENHCISENTKLNWGGECNADDGVCWYIEGNCKWGCDPNTNQCMTNPNQAWGGESVPSICGSYPNTYCCAGYLENCSDFPVRHCCPSNWIGDGYGDCFNQYYDCDLECYYDSSGTHCNETGCQDGGDCDSTLNVCHNPLYPYSGNVDDGPWCDTCKEDNSWAWGSCCCDSFYKVFNFSCKWLFENWGLTCEDCKCEHPEDQIEPDCYNVGWHDPCPGDAQPGGCCPWPWVKDCRCNNTCAYAFWIGDGYCDVPETFDDDLTCYGNDGGDCPGQVYCGPPNDCTGQANEGLVNCWCDSLCEGQGDCCPDACQHCGYGC